MTASSPSTASGGQCRVYNRAIVADMVADGQMDELPPPPPRTAPQKKQDSTRSSKHKELLNRVHEQRKKDQTQIKKNVERNKEVRERRFERLLNSCVGSDEVILRGQVTEMLRQQHNMVARKVGTQFQEWNEKVFENVQQQLDTIMNPPSRELIQTFQGMKNVDFTLPEEKRKVKSSSFRISPCYKDLVKLADENSFRYNMDVATETALKHSAKNSMDVARAQYQGSLKPVVAKSSSSSSLPTNKHSAERQAMYAEALSAGVDTKLLHATQPLKPGMGSSPEVPKYDLDARFRNQAIPLSADVAYRVSNNAPDKHNPDLHIHGIDYDPYLHYLDMLDPNKVGYNADEPRQVTDPLLARSKPVLEPNLWGQLAIQSTPYGHFAQVCAQGADYKKDRNFVPDESDNVPAAGKRKTRFTRNDVGILKGEVAKRGESILNKTDVGASNAAPNQDHFTYEKGTRVVDGEFPLGKMMLPHKH
ncbi:unnamed protein product [Amoebophrya sp. A120]|nr:unnamed protein product [Amoebophrya sp. A120]|eukprot:GSA120T00015109001.1